MERYLWLFPLVLVLHELEEIIGLGIWIQKNQLLMNHRFKRIQKQFLNYTTEGYALASAELLVISILISAGAYHFKWYYLWCGCFIGFTFHLVVHIIQVFVIRKYIPAVITAVILIPSSVLIIKKSVYIVQYSKLDLLIWSGIGFLFLVINLFIQRFIMKKFSKYLRNIKIDNTP